MANASLASPLDTPNRTGWLRTLHGNERPSPVVRRVVLEVWDGGGALLLEFARSQVSMSLPEVATQVLFVLLAPMAARAGEFVSDDELLGRVVPARDDSTACEAKRLVIRTRLVLEERGVHSAHLIRRAPNSAATRFAAPRGAEVSIRWREASPGR